MPVSPRIPQIDGGGDTVSAPTGAWSAVTMTDGNNSVVCSSTSFCIAADQDDNLMYYAALAARDRVGSDVAERHGRADR